MILSVHNFPTIANAVSVSYSLYNMTTNTTDQAYTTTGVVEVVTDATAGTSSYHVDSALVLADNEYVVRWRTGSSVPSTASESINKTITGSLLVYGSVVYNAANTSASFYTSLVETTANFANNAWIKFISGTLKDQVQKVSGYTVSGGILTLNLPLTAIPVTGSFTGTIAAYTLTFPSLTAGTVAIGQQVTGVGVSANTIITAGAGLSWTVSKTQAVGPVAMSSGPIIKIINQ